MSMTLEEKLDHWIDHGYNALFIGLHGVGKTARVRDAFNRKFGKQGVDWLYFSAATMDPWVDFIGVPKEYTDEEKKITYLKLIRPYCIELGTVKAMFFDELNRAHSKVRNAIMELMQFRSINGSEMPNLKCLWGAINPKDNDKLAYDVDHLDPSQEDRFHVSVEIPYKPDLAYLKGKYSDQLATAANDWWNALNEETKLKVSPRRLDYALRIFEEGGDLRDVLPKESHVPALLDALMNGSPARVFEGLVREIEKELPGAKEKMRDFLKKDKNYKIVEEKIIKQSRARVVALPLLTQEQISTLIANHPSVKAEVFTNSPATYADLIKDIATNGQNKRIKRDAQKAMQTLSLQDNNGNIDLPVRECKLPTWQKDTIATNFEFNKKGSYKLLSQTKPEVDAPDWKKGLAGLQQQCTFSDNIFRGRKAMLEVVKYAFSGMSKDQASDMIKYIEWFVTNTPYDKIESFPEIHEIINTTFVDYMEGCKGPAHGEDATVADLFKVAPHTIGKFLFPRLTAGSNDWFIKMKANAKVSVPFGQEQSMEMVNNA